MQTFLQTVVLGVGRGALDALLAMGIVLIYRTTGVLNFSQAAIGSVGAYILFAVSQGWPLWLAVSCGVLSSAGLGVAAFGVVNGIRSGPGTPVSLSVTPWVSLTAAVATLAIAILLEQVIRVEWGAVVSPYPNPFGLSSLTIGGVDIAYVLLSATLTASALALLLGAYLRWTRNGAMLRAISAGRDAARLCGANVPLLLAAVWAVSGALASIAAFYAAELGFFPGFLDTYFVAALIAAVLGGLRSLSGAFLGAVGLEVARNLFTAYAPGSLTPYTQTFLILLLIAVLVLVPRSWLAPAEGRAV